MCNRSVTIASLASIFNTSPPGFFEKHGIVLNYHWFHSFGELRDGRADLMQQPTVTPLIHVVPVHAWKPANSPCMLISAVNVPDPWYTSLDPLAHKRPPVLAGPIANKGQCGVTNQDMLAQCLRKGVSYLNCLCLPAAGANILPCSPTHFLLRLPDTDSVCFRARPHNLPTLVHLPTPSSCAALQPSQDTESTPLASPDTL